MSGGSGANYSAGNAPSSGAEGRWAVRSEVARDAPYRDEYPSITTNTTAGAVNASSANNTTTASIASSTGGYTGASRADSQSRAAPTLTVPGVKPPVPVVKPSIAQAQVTAPALPQTTQAVPPPVPPSRQRVDSSASVTGLGASAGGVSGVSASASLGPTLASTAANVLSSAVENNIASVEPVRLKRAHSDGAVPEPRLDNANDSAHSSKKSKHESREAGTLYENRHKKDATPVKKPAPTLPVAASLAAPGPAFTTSLFDTLSKFKSSAPPLTASASTTYTSITGLSIETPSLTRDITAPLSSYKPSLYTPSATVNTTSAGASSPMRPENTTSSAAAATIPTSATTSAVTEERRPRVAWGQGEQLQLCFTLT